MYTVQVLLSTYNGESYIKEQLDSILNQEGVSIRLLVRDDGSTDSTKDILHSYKEKYENMECIYGENAGVVASFFRLFELSDQSVDYYALSDQDDVWDSDKLKVACEKLEEMRSEHPIAIQEDSNQNNNKKSNKKKNNRKKKNKQPEYDAGSFPIPLLYCSDALNTDENLCPLPDRMQTIGQTRVPDFRNALIENIARGASIVFNKALMSYIRISMPQNIYMHDWWLYLVASCFGDVYYDSEAHYKYRQHAGNMLGAAAPYGISKLSRRLRQSRTNGGHVSKQAAAFTRIYRIPKDKQVYVDILTKYQNVRKYRKMAISGKYLFRQTANDNFIFRMMFLFNNV